MKMAQLHNPMVLTSQGSDSRDIVDDPGTDSVGKLWRQGLESLSPATGAFVPWQNDGIGKIRLVLIAGFESHYVENPSLALEVKPQSIADQYQSTIAGWHWSSRVSQIAQHPAKAVANHLDRSSGIPRPQLSQPLALQHNAQKELSVQSSCASAASARTNRPGPQTLRTTTSSFAPGINRCLATGRLRMFGMHTCEFSIFQKTTSSINRSFYGSFSTDFVCLALTCHQRPQVVAFDRIK
jgi:hypothetical protein